MKNRYIIVFFITLAIFLTTFWLSGFFGDKKLDELRDIQQKIALDILSTETRYSLLEKTSCNHVVVGSEAEFGLSGELNDLARKLKFMESQLPASNQDLVFVQKYYSLLQIKDYLLVEALSDRCGQDIFTILYFHENDCKDCVRQALVLDQLVSDYPGTRVYWLDRDIDSPAMKTLISLFNVESAPTIVIEGKTYRDFVDYESMAEILPEALKEYQEDDAESATDSVLEEDLQENVKEGQ